MMKSFPSPNLPNPATLPSKPRRQGPRAKAALVFTLVLTILLLYHQDQATQRGPLGSAARWLRTRPILTAALVPAKEGKTWRNSTLLVDKSEDHLPPNFRPLGPDADACYQLRLPDFDEYVSSILLKVSTLFQPTMAENVTGTITSYLINSSIPAGEGDSGTFHGPHSQTIWQTDKSHGTWHKELEEWDDKHREIGWVTERLDDAEANAWIHHHFAGTDIEWTWDFMTRPILRADFLRYLLLFLNGGFWADADTSPVHPVSEWGTLDPIIIDISYTDGPDWRANMAKKPSIVVGLEVNPIAWENWATWIARPISFVQFAFGSTAQHPIFLDVVDRIVQRTKIVDEREKWMEADRKWRKTAEEKSFISQIENETHRPVVLDWTGPVVFTDAIVSWLTARYKISWQRIRGYDRPIRIGDVLILPHGALNAGLMQDHVNGGFLPQAQLQHFLHGSAEDGWKQQGP